MSTFFYRWAQNFKGGTNEKGSNLKRKKITKKQNKIKSWTQIYFNEHNLCPFQIWKGNKLKKKKITNLWVEQTNWYWFWKRVQVMNNGHKFKYVLQIWSFFLKINKLFYIFCVLGVAKKKYSKFMDGTQIY